MQVDLPRNTWRPKTPWPVTEVGIDFYTSEAITPSDPLRILRYVCFEDPDGTVIELAQYND